MIHLAIAVLLALPSAANAKKAPEFKIAKVFNAPVSEITSLASLKGKVVYLEFWATWCAPCVAGMPRTNRMIDALKGEPVVFLAVTDEPADMIAAFLKTHEFKGWIGIDEEKSSLKAYKNKRRPDGWLIGKDGTLLGRISPEQLEESDVRAALAGRYKPRAETLAFNEAERPSAPKAGKSFFELSISSASGKPSMMMGGDDLEANAMPFSLIVSWIWGVEDDQVIAENPPVETFSVRLKTPPDGFEKGRELLKRAVQDTFGVTVAQELKVTDVYLLSLSTAPGAPRPAAGDPALKSGIMRSGGGRLLGKATMPRFAKALWMSSSKPVVDDTGLAGEYSLDLEWKRGDDADRARALAAQGLRLAPGRRTVEFLRVEPANKK